MDLIYYLIAILQLLIEFVIENIGFVIGIVIIIAGMASSRKKAKRAKQAEEASKEYRPFDEDYKESPAPKPFAKTFKNLMAEIEAEFNEQQEAKPWDIPQEGRGSAEGRPQRTPSGFPEGGSAYPKKAPVQPKVKNTAVPPKPTVEPAQVVIPGDLTASNPGEKPRKKTKKPNDLVTAVVMSEVLGKPKGLQD